jgi:hypothetical protein
MIYNLYKTIPTGKNYLRFRMQDSEGKILTFNKFNDIDIENFCVSLGSAKINPIFFEHLLEFEVQGNTQKLKIFLSEEYPEEFI